MMRLSERELAIIDARRPFLQSVQGATGVPWQAIAAIWYRENSLSTASPRTPGGPFQFDPVPPAPDLAWLLGRYSRLPYRTCARYVALGVNDFEAAAHFAACFMRHKVGPVVTPEASDELIKDVFWAYNGRAYGSADRSPYVMNGYSDRHTNMRIIGSVPDGKGGRLSINEIDKRPGAFTVYHQLKSLWA